MNQELVKLIGDNTLYQFGRDVYKNTDCGPWLVYVLSDGSEVYYSSPEASVTLYQLAERGLSITAIQVGSIVEGSDAEVVPHIVRINDQFTRKDLCEAVNAVNLLASWLWLEANHEEIS